MIASELEKQISPIYERTILSLILWTVSIDSLHISDLTGSWTGHGNFAHPLSWTQEEEIGQMLRFSVNIYLHFRLFLKDWENNTEVIMMNQDAFEVQQGHKKSPVIVHAWKTTSVIHFFLSFTEQ